MTKQPMQAMPEKGAEKPDGVNDTPAKNAAGESGGGAYPNPQTGKKPENGGFMGHGGQTGIAYSGPQDDHGDNAVTKDD
jgi:hypothetical protein